MSDCALASLPEQPEEHANAGGDKQRLDRLFLHVLFEIFFHFHGALAALIVVLARLVAELLVLLRRGVADLSAEVAEILADLRSSLAQFARTACLLTAANLAFARIVYARHVLTPFAFDDLTVHNRRKGDSTRAVPARMRPKSIGSLCIFTRAEQPQPPARRFLVT
jgi:hypothetical protein